ncbi:MAG: DUF2075 domain-containing protein, partial [Cyanobium sp. D14.bin.5]|nr:DUF2075 domain-containing protein [Cyanobium sp. D14.bin.5]
MAAPEGHYDALIVDESHRLMTKTIYNKEGENQIKEIIHASKLIVYGAHPRSSSGANTTRPSCTAINCHRSDVTPFAAPVLMRAGGLVRPLSIAGGFPGACAPGEPNAVCRRCTRFG